MGTTAVDAPEMAREDLLDLYVWLDAFGHIGRVLADTTGRYEGASPAATLLPANRHRLFDVKLCDAFTSLGWNEYNELWPAEEGDAEKNPEFREAITRGRTLAAQMLMLMAGDGSSDYFRGAAAELFFVASTGMHLPKGSPNA